MFQTVGKPGKVKKISLKVPGAREKLAMRQKLKVHLLQSSKVKSFFP